MPSSSALPGAGRSDLLIAFDADDTLWHNEIYYRQAGEKLKQLLDRHLHPAQVERVLAETEVRNIRWYGYGFKSFTLSMIETALEVTSGNIAAGDIRSILEFGREMLGADVLLFEHARPALTRLAQIHDLMLITKGDLVEQQSKLRRSGLAPLFKYTEIVPEKSAPAYLALLDRYAISPERFVMVGNSLKSDVLPVLEIGARAVFVPYEHTWAHEHADGGGRDYLEIEHLGLLPDLIAGLERKA
jgi:putative hydrolase of the HAD superfamily